MADRSSLAPFHADPAAAALLTDFDGTLSPIVDDPAEARALDGAAGVLSALARGYGRVAVVSGRPVAFLRHRLPAGGVALAGLYGLEVALPGEPVRRHPDAERWAPVVEEVAGRAEAGDSGLHVERKGLTVTLHYRTAPHAADRARAWVTAEAERTGLAVRPARMSFELVPPVGRDKGVAVAELAAGFRAVLFAGDDLGDLPAFDALDALAAAGAAAVRVAVRSPEVPPELLARADLAVDGPAGALDLLRSLLPPPGP